MMPEKERRNNHMRFGLALCANALNAKQKNDELFFMSVHQINKAGPEIISDPSQRVMVAALNCKQNSAFDINHWNNLDCDISQYAFAVFIVKAGKRSVELSDMMTAFKLFENGTFFLGRDSWKTDYELSLNLYDAVCDAACAINNAAAVSLYSEQVLNNGRCSEDKLPCEYSFIAIEAPCLSSPTPDNTYCVRNLKYDRHVPCSKITWLPRSS